jgi:hypothetical protein
MGVTFGFYNSLDGDRKYNMAHISSIFDGVVNDGVFMSIGDKLMAEAAGGMNINVGTGRAWFNHTWTLNDATLPLVTEPSEVLLNRIDTLVLEVDATDSARANSIKIVKGTPASEPVAPVMIETNTVHQHRLTDIYVGAGVTEIVQANLTNFVGTGSCPFVTGILETMNIDALIAQWGSQWNVWLAATQADSDTWTTEKRAAFLAWMAEQEQSFDTWFTALTNALDENAAAQLAAHLVDKDNPHGVTASQINAASKSSVDELQRSATVVTTGGTAPVYTLTVSPQYASLEKPFLVKFHQAAAAGSWPTLNVNSIGGFSMMKSDGAAFVPKKNQCAWMVLISGIGFFVVSPGGGAEFPATPTAGNTPIYVSTKKFSVPAYYGYTDKGYNIIVNAGTYRFTYTVMNNSGATAGHMQLTKNGVAVPNSEAIGYGTNATKTIDVVCATGDIIRTQLSALDAASFTVNDCFIISLLAGDVQAEINKFITVTEI